MKQKFYGYIFETKNLLNGMMYIGLRSKSFHPRYFGSGKRLKPALRKYGKDNFSIKVIAHASSYSEINKLEKKFISLYRKKFGEEMLYNLDDGGHRNGFRGSHRNLETRIKIGATSRKRNKKLSAEERKRRFGGMRGHKHSKETIIKMRLAVKNRPPISDETRLKMSISSSSRIGRKHSLKTRKLLSVAARNRPPASQKTRDRIGVATHYRFLICLINSQSTRSSSIPY